MSLVITGAGSIGIQHREWAFSCSFTLSTLCVSSACPFNFLFAFKSFRYIGR
jgi:hypothetical protein